MCHQINILVQNGYNSPPPVVFTIPVVVDSATNLNNSAVIIPDGMLAKESSSNLFKIGDGTKTWSQLPYVNVPATAAPKAPGTAAVGTSAKYAREDHVHPVQTTITGNAATATKLATARTISLTGPVTGSTTFDGSGNVSLATTVDFSGMPTDKFEAMLKSIWVPIKLTANKNFYVNGSTGSDTLSTGRGESASLPFKTIQACVNYVTQNYNISTTITSIIVATGTYTEKLELANFSHTSGYIQISVTSLTEDVRSKTILVSPSAQTPITVAGGSWLLRGLTVLVNATNVTTRTYSSWISQTDGFLYIHSLIFKLTISNSSGLRWQGLVISSATMSFLMDALNNQIIVSGTGAGMVYGILVSADGKLTFPNTNSAAASKDFIFSGTFTTCVRSSGGKINIGSGASYGIQFTSSGTIAGKRYECDSGGTIYTGGKGENFFPGSIAGTVDSSTYSWYK